MSRSCQNVHVIGFVEHKDNAGPVKSGLNRKCSLLGRSRFTARGICGGPLGRNGSISHVIIAFEKALGALQFIII
jgi:hypothetical protein